MQQHFPYVLHPDSAMTICTTKIALLAGFISLASCGTFEEGEALPPPPSHFPEPLYWPAVPAAQRELGRHLFHEPLLSADVSISCASCHAQVHAFADHNVKLSAGIHGQLGTRNSPPLFNLAWHPNFMWDGGINHLEWVSLSPIENPVELGETLAGVIAKLQNHSSYPDFFKHAYGNDEITGSGILKALAVFMASLVSDQSPYDRFIKGKHNLSASQNRGYEIFKLHCAQCHSEPLFTSFGFASHGEVSGNDPGRYGITQNPADFGLFKIPSLRNLEFTYPYMHDGRFFSLEEVIKNWESENPEGLQFTEKERSDLISFLNTLNDERFTYAEEFAEPKAIN
jgi:cytochrome c peroxidase